MNLMALLQRINELRLTAGIPSERALSVRAGLGADFLRHIRLGLNNDPSADKLAKIAHELGVPLEDLMIAAGKASQVRAGDEMIKIEPIEVVGAVKAGTFLDAVEWHVSERWRIYLPPSTRYPGVRRFALKLEGDSMNRLYPLPDTLVICAPMVDLQREPVTDEVVVVQRWRHDLVEATCKVFTKRGKEIWLEPRSTNDAHHPIRVVRTRAELAAATRDKNTVVVDKAVFENHPKDIESIMVTALVIGAYSEQ